jgi:TRAP-type C4-dicarboxylate transport system permease small subunit
MRIVERLINGLANLLAAVAGVIVLLMMLHVSIDVIGKFFFNHPIDGTIELVAAYYMVAIIFLPLAYVSRGEGQIKVEMFTQKLTGRKLALLEGVVGIFTLLYLVFFVWRTGISAVEKTIQGEMWESAADYVHVWPSRWFLPIGTAAMAIFVAQRIIRDFRGERQPTVYTDNE